jgi:integrase/recombinase XerD
MRTVALDVHKRFAEVAVHEDGALRRLGRIETAQLREACVESVMVAAVAAWRDQLQAAGLAPSSVAQRVCAVRRLAAAVGADPLVAQVRCTQVQHARPRALSDRELSALLARPDLRTTIGIRDRAILELLARAGLSPSELARLTLTDVQERGRQPDARRRAAIARSRGEQTPLELVVRGAKRGRTRTIPLHAHAHDALRRWYAARPAAATDALFVSLRTRQSAVPEALSASAVGDVVAKHAATAAVREDRRTAHALRHTFCTMLAERGVALEVIRALAGHVDVRTTQVYATSPTSAKATGSLRLSATHTRWRRRLSVCSASVRARSAVAAMRRCC